MLWYEFGVALCLVLVIEGILPSLFPHYWKEQMLTISKLDTGIIRLIGVASMLAGSMFLYLIR